ncbi:hypothetical protein AVEN_46917-1, partial [Araneus ventricosus]
MTRRTSELTPTLQTSAPHQHFLLPGLTPDWVGQGGVGVLYHTSGEDVWSL